MLQNEQIMPKSKVIDFYKIHLQKEKSKNSHHNCTKKHLFHSPPPIGQIPKTQHKTSSPLKLQTQHKAYSPFHSTHSFFDFLLPGKKTHKSNIKLEKMIFWQISKKSNCENCCYNFFFSFLTSLGKYWLFFWRIDRAFWKIGFFWVWVRGGILEGSRRPNFQEKKFFPVQTNYTRFSNIFP